MSCIVRWAAALGFGLGLILAGSACSKENTVDASVTNTDVVNTTTQVVGPAGAILGLEDGAQVDIPAGALTTDQTITIGHARAGDAPPMPEGLTSAGRTYFFKPHGQTFALPVAIRVPYVDKSDASTRLITSDPNGSWTELAGADLQPPHARIRTTHFSFFTVVTGDASLPVDDRPVLGPVDDAGAADASDPVSDASAVDAEPDVGLTDVAPESQSPACNQVDLIVVVENSAAVAGRFSLAGFDMLGLQFETLVGRLALGGVSWRLVLLSSRADKPYGLCVPEPVGGIANCVGAANDDAPPAFLHRDVAISDSNALDLIVADHANYQQALRPTAAKHLVVVTHGDATLAAEEFRANLLALDDTWQGFVFHGIFAQTECPWGDAGAQSGEIGTQYAALVSQTGGQGRDWCMIQSGATTPDLSPDLTAIGDRVLELVKAPCL